MIYPGKDGAYSVCVSNIYDQISVKMSNRILQAEREHISVYLSNKFDQI